MDIFSVPSWKEGSKKGEPLFPFTHRLRIWIGPHIEYANRAETATRTKTKGTLDKDKGDAGSKAT